MAEKKGSSKVKKKLWFQLEGDGMFNGLNLGESHVYESEKLVGKTVQINLMNVVNDFKKQNTNLQFKITHVKENKGYASIIGYMLSVSSIKRLVRRGYIKIEQAFVCETSDKKLVCIKTIMLISAKCKSSVRALIRGLTKQFLVKQTSKMTYEGFVNNVISGKLQNTLYGRVKKLYPVRVCEIRRFQVVDSDKKVAVEKVQEEPKEEVKEVPKDVVKEVPKEEVKHAEVAQ
jgi:ribosomal protein S3AE